MRKLIYAILLALVGFTVSFAVTPVTTSGVNFENTGIISTINSAGAFDTLVDADSTTLISNFSPPDGQEILYVRDAITGTGADSVALQVVVDAFNASGTFLFRTVVDSVTSASSATPGEAMSIPLYGGAKYRIKLIAYGSSLNGHQIIINRGYLVGRRILTWYQNWK